MKTGKTVKSVNYYQEIQDPLLLYTSQPEAFSNFVKVVFYQAMAQANAPPTNQTDAATPDQVRTIVRQELAQLGSFADWSGPTDTETSDLELEMNLNAMF